MSSRPTRCSIGRTGRLTSVVLVFCLLAFAGLAADDADKPFLVLPYVQIGDSPRNQEREEMLVLWQAAAGIDGWSVTYRETGSASWRSARDLESVAISPVNVAPHRVWSARLSGLAPGAEVEYRVLLRGTPVFEASTRARKVAGSPVRFVVVGDVGADTKGQREIAYLIHREKPDFIVIPGDIVYNYGTIRDYRARFYPFWNADTSSPETGAPILRSVPVFGGLGNHDVSYQWYMLPDNLSALYDDFANLNANPDGLAYFLYWRFPLNGPIRDPRLGNSIVLSGEPSVVEPFRTASRPRFPVMSNYSFEYGDANWVVLDTWTPNTDWNSQVMRRWLDKELASAKSQWRFVATYEPPFDSYRGQPWQRMRAVADLFEKNGVSVAFSGCWHSYQRSAPLRFRISEEARRRPARGVRVEIPGQIVLDEKFNGQDVTRPDGVIYLVTGAGGATTLLGGDQTNNPSTWQPFTRRYIGDRYSFTVVDVSGNEMRLRQISQTGEVLDSLRITR